MTTAGKTSGFRSTRLFGWIATALLVASAPGGPAHGDPLTVFAAASTTDAVGAVIAQYQRDTGIDTRGVFASSSTLAKQIVNGAPADLYLSASKAWMSYAEAEGAILTGSRIDLLGNELVLIAPKASAMEIRLAPGAPLAQALQGKRLAIGDPDHVPAGIYAKDALQALGLWQPLTGKLALAADVRGALILVDRAVAGAGIVYATDAAISTGVRIVDRFPPDSHSLITYPAGVVAAGQTARATALLGYLHGPEGRRLFDEYGFRVLAPGS